ncbi:hypothetical protein, partial [Mesorhizobium sp. M1D.F.Ca.ET.183.01.1.1]
FALSLHGFLMNEDGCQPVAYANGMGCYRQCGLDGAGRGKEGSVSSMRAALDLPPWVKGEEAAMQISPARLIKGARRNRCRRR